MPQLEKALLACKIAQGFFEDERIVEFAVDEETTYQTIADKEDVKEIRDLQGYQWIEGLLQVSVVGRDGEMVLVNLPREAAGNGRRLWVPQSLLQRA